MVGAEKEPLNSGKRPRAGLGGRPISSSSALAPRALGKYMGYQCVQMNRRNTLKGIQTGAAEFGREAFAISWGGKQGRMCSGLLSELSNHPRYCPNRSYSHTHCIWLRLWHAKHPGPPGPTVLCQSWEMVFGEKEPLNSRKAIAVGAGRKPSFQQSGFTE
jgi:hypothetical protein